MTLQVTEKPQNIDTDIPPGYIKTKLNEICILVPTGIDQYVGKLEYFSTGAITKNSVSPEDSYTFNSRPARANRLSKSKDVFQARMKDTNKALFITDILKKKLFSTGFIQFRCYDCSDMSKFLYYYVQSPQFLSQKDAYATGSTQVALTDNGLSKINLLVPPLNEQKRIGTKIEELFSQIHKMEKTFFKIKFQSNSHLKSFYSYALSGKITKTWREQNKPSFMSNTLEKYSEIRKTEFEKIYQDAVKNKMKKPQKPTCLNSKFNLVDSFNYEIPESWTVTTLNQLSAPVSRSIQSGPFGSSLLHSEFQKSGFLVIGIDNVNDGIFSIGSEHRISKEKFKKLEQFQARSNDLLITVMATIGRACLVPENIEPSIITKHVYRVTLDPELCIPKYVLHCVKGGSFVSDFFSAKNRGVTRPGLNGSIIKLTPIPLPPIEEQQIISQQLDNTISNFNNIQSVCAKSIRHLHFLSNSILKMAFDAKLVPQDPNDESAKKISEDINKSKNLTKIPINIKEKKRGVRKNVK